MDTRIIEYILTIQEEKTLTKAAERLFITQSALSQQLKKLEAEIGTPLFYRKNNEFHLTDAGKIYAHNGQSILFIKDKAMKKIQSFHSKSYEKLQLIVPEPLKTALYPLIYPKFHEKFPDIILEFHSIPQNTSESPEEQVLSLNILPSILLNQRDYDFIPLGFEELHLGLPKNHPCCKEKFTITDFSLFHDDLFIISQPQSYLHQISHDIFQQYKYQPKLICETLNIHTTRHLLNQQQGITFFPCSLKKEEDSFCCLPLSTNYLLHIGIAFHKDTSITDSLKELILLLLISFDQNRELAALTLL